MPMPRIGYALAALTLGIPAFLAPGPASAQVPADCQLFQQTGKQICGRFLQYWKEHGGIAQQGYPISGEFPEQSATDGKTYTVQYFERAVFELHPENQPPYDVLLSLLGTEAFKRRYPNGAPELPPPMNPVAGRFFPETGKEIRGVFLDYWQTHGGLAQQGFPISNPLVEKSEVDGKEYTVQYFERAVFEMHPENQAPYNVLLSQLGTLELKRKYPNGAPSGQAGSEPPPGGQVPAFDVWAQLRSRPLKLPVLGPNTACQQTSGKSINPEYGAALGSGPAYPVGFGTEGRIDLAGLLRDAGGYVIKVLWVVEPNYSKPVLVRGGQTNGPGEVRFGEGANPSSELHLDPSQGAAGSSGWHEWPTYTRLPSTGCFAYQVDTPDGSQVINFQAIMTMP